MVQLLQKMRQQHNYLYMYGSGLKALAKNIYDTICLRKREQRGWDTEVEDIVSIYSS